MPASCWLLRAEAGISPPMKRLLPSGCTSDAATGTQKTRPSSSNRGRAKKLRRRRRNMQHAALQRVAYRVATCSPQPGEQRALRPDAACTMQHAAASHTASRTQPRRTGVQRPHRLSACAVSALGLSRGERSTCATAICLAVDAGRVARTRTCSDGPSDLANAPHSRLPRASSRRSVVR